MEEYNDLVNIDNESFTKPNFIRFIERGLRSGYSVTSLVYIWNEKFVRDSTDYVFYNKDVD